MGTCGQIWEQPGTNREIRLPGMHLTIFVKIKESKRIGNPWILFLHKSVTVNLSHLVTTHHHTPTPELTVKTNCSANRGLVATWKMMRLQMSITNLCMWWCRLGLIQWNHSIFIHAERERGRESMQLLQARKQNMTTFSTYSWMAKNRSMNSCYLLALPSACFLTWFSIICCSSCCTFGKVVRYYMSLRLESFNIPNLLCVNDSLTWREAKG